MNKKIKLRSIKKINGEVYLPGSKSISNRILLLSALSDKKTTISNLLDSDDTKYMLKALQNLGIKYKLFDNNKSCIIHGNINSFQILKKTTLFLGNAGTAVRPLTAIFSLKKNNIILTGEPRMLERPIGHLVNALRQGGSDIRYLKKDGFLPIHIKGGYVGGEIYLKGNISSQFLTSLLIASPLSKNDTKIFISGKLVSKPYVDLTIKLMEKFGVLVKKNEYSSFFIKGNQKYKSPGKFLVEGDASSASYFLAAAAIKGGTVKVHGIGKNAFQGDIDFANILKKMGANISWGENFISCTKNKLNAVQLDMNHIPDAAMTIAMVALFSNGITKIKNVYNWRLKESDRLSAMATELKKIGAKIEEGKDYIFIEPPSKFVKSKINTYNDHRIAMCFSLIALSDISVTILDPNCVDKTFPSYFTEFEKISFYN
ncbi:3-phosphoshikimate 1-carboxyvinyltransferase [Buchnera aphidicola (Mindarus keteleerifoliae)]|uniref:3-phosphoshikimate 1-carboxyvinyltransferase n=1 Tax=Buchnera aphidicola TaxID=9 RepID=UPI0031B6C208